MTLITGIETLPSPCRQNKVKKKLQSVSQRQHLPVEYELNVVTGNSREEGDTTLFSREENPTMESPYYVNIKQSAKYESTDAAEDDAGDCFFLKFSLKVVLVVPCSPEKLSFTLW